MTEILLQLILRGSSEASAGAEVGAQEDSAMSLVDVIREKQEALRVRDLAQLLGVSQQQIYKMAASGEIPSFKVANAVRFDPHETAEWLKEKYPVRSVALRFPEARRA